jgi:hypothetical protein
VGYNKFINRYEKSIFYLAQLVLLVDRELLFQLFVDTFPVLPQVGQFDDDELLYDDVELLFHEFVRAFWLLLQVGQDVFDCRFLPQVGQVAVRL